MNIAALLAKTALSYSDRPAITWGTETWSDYAGFHRVAGAIGGALNSDYGLEAGDRVAITMSNRPEFLETLFVFAKSYFQKNDAHVSSDSIVESQYNILLNLN